MKKAVVSQKLKRVFTLSANGVLFYTNFILEYFDDEDWRKVEDIHNSNVVELESIVTELVAMVEDINEQKGIDMINTIMHNQINFISE